MSVRSDSGYEMMSPAAISSKYDRGTFPLFRGNADYYNGQGGDPEEGKINL